MTTQDNHVAALREALNARLRAAMQDDEHSHGYRAGVQDCLNDLNALSQPPAPEQASGEADAHLTALMRYTEAFYGSAIEHGMKAGPVADCVAHVERAARALHALAIRAATPTAEPGEAVVQEDKDILTTALYAFSRDTRRNMKARIRANELRQAMLSASTAAEPGGVVVPDGFVLVPAEPTPEMLQASFAASDAWALSETTEELDAWLYRAMLSASPAAPVAAKPDQQAQAGEPTGCACRWDKDDNRVQTCERHQGWLDVVHEWAERAKSAETAIAKKDAALLADGKAGREVQTEFFWLCELMEQDIQHHGGKPQYVANTGRFKLTDDPYKAARFGDMELCQAVCTAAHSQGDLFVRAVEHGFDTRPQQAAQVAQPLTDFDISQMRDFKGDGVYASIYKAGVRDAEKSHGIGKDQAS